ncbi:MAG: hypothetical protein IJ542_00755 [Clostridia bacterium]|nr:hypothetical protein [Clostridia bacterium]
MADNKKFLILSLITSFIYIALAVVLLVINKLNTISVVLCAVIVLIALVSTMLCWKIMHDQNHRK